MSTTLNLINISITSHSFHFLCVIRTVKIYSFHKLQVYNIVLLPTITVLYHISRMYSSCTTEPLYSLINTSPFHSPPSLWQPPFYSLLLCVWLFWKRHTSGIMQNLSFWDSLHLIQCFPDPSMDKENAVYSYNGILFSLVLVFLTLWLLCFAFSSLS